MRIGRKAKAFILSALALFGVGTASVATAAWFTVRTQSPELAMQTATPDLRIDNENVTGYKINPTLGPDGFPDYSSNTVAHKKGSSYETENNNQANADTNFDVPASGIGFYLVKKNPGDTYKYQYEGEAYSWRFDDFENASINYVRISGFTVSTDDRFIVRDYSYDVAHYKTVNVKVAIEKDNGNFSIDSETYEITPTTAGTYTIWLNKATNKLTFEQQQDIPSLHPASQSLKKETPLMAGGATPADNTVYILYDGTGLWGASARIFLEVKSGGASGNWFEFADSGYKYNDVAIYYATANASITTFDIIRRDPTHTATWNWSEVLSFNSSKNYLVFQSFSDKILNFNQSAFSSVIYDGFVAVGISSTEGSSFYGKTWDAAGAIRLDGDASNLGKKVLDLRAGDKFKLAYMKGSSVTVEEYNYYANNSDGATRMEVYGGEVSDYFTTDSDKNCVVKTGVSIHCTIYFTNAKKINVNVTSTLIVKAAKFDFEGSFVEVDATDAGSTTAVLGKTVSKATINGLTLTIPSGYSRETGDDVYLDENCTMSIGTEVTADVNPKIVYIKVEENPITIYLTPYFSDTSSGSDGTADTTRKMTIDDQFGAVSSISESDLHDLWNATYGDNLTYNNIAYGYARIETSSHSAPISTGTIADGTELFVRYVRVVHTVTLRPSYFAPGGNNRLSFTIQSSQYENILDYSDFSTAKTFDNCEYKDHENGIWYVFERADANWYTDPGCTTTVTGKITANATLYAKMVAKPVTTFYIDADYPGWNVCYLHMWGTLPGVESSMESSLTAMAVTTDNYNKVYKISIPTERITGFLLHAGHDSGKKTVDIPISDLTGSTSKYCYISGNTESARTATFTEEREAHATGVWVQKRNGNSWDNVTGGQLLFGDGVGNDYILETGLQLTNNDVIRVYDSGTDTAYGYAQYVEGNKTKHTYVANNTVSASGDSLKISRLGTATATARFNFYVTHAGELSIAMVPDYGNGFYIMKYNGTDKTENYIGAIKMDSAGYAASYNGWYCGNINEKIYIRSYLDAVDNICTSLVTNSFATMKTEEGDDQYCITFNATGHYNIRVTGQIVEISQYEINDFFALNRLDSSLLAEKTNDAKQKEIWRQKTAVVMEIPFYANNTYPASVSLKTDCSASWVGVRFAVYDHQLELPYETLHGSTNEDYTSTYLTAANSSSPIADTQDLTINPNTSTLLYAYVLIDYRCTVTSANLAEAKPEVGLYLQVTQR